MLYCFAVLLALQLGHCFSSFLFFSFFFSCGLRTRQHLCCCCPRHTGLSKKKKKRSQRAGCILGSVVRVCLLLSEKTFSFLILRNSSLRFF